MKIADRHNPVRAGWLAERGLRLDASPYLSGAFEARKLLQRLSVRKDPLNSITAGHEGGIYNGPKFRRLYVTDRSQGVPFIGSTDIMLADLTQLPMLSSSVASKLGYLRLLPGTSLISCSGTIGRMAYTRPDMADSWSSQDVMKVVPDAQKIRAGYLFAFLRSRFGVPIITSSAYGAIIQHIEPHHIADLPIPRFGDAVEGEIHELIERTASLRAGFQAALNEATGDLFTSAGLPELLDPGWHTRPRDVGFTVDGIVGHGVTSLRALNYSPRARHILDALRAIPHRELGEICSRLETGKRFKRIDTDSESGHRLIGQRQAFWSRPEGRFISLTPAGLSDVRVADETVLLAAQGTLGENEVFMRPLLVTGSWLSFVFSQHFLRITSGDQGFPGAYLFAFLRSEAMFRALRSMSTGGKQQDIHPRLRSAIPVPECTPQDRERIAERVRGAYRDRDEADRLEDRALELLENAVREAARG